MTNYFSVFERCNETELYQRCRKAGLVVQPGTPKKELIAYLLGDEEPAPRVHEMDSNRMGLIGFLLDYWSVVRAQISCPAKALETEVDADFHPLPDWETRVSNTRKPIACFSCVDTQVLSCLVQNETNRNLIQLKKKPVPEKPMTMSTVTAVAPKPETAPRDLEGLKNLKRYNLRRLMEQLNAFTDEKSLSSFLVAPLEEQAQAAFVVLQNYDRGKAENQFVPPTAPPAAETPKPARQRQPSASTAAAPPAAAPAAPAAQPPAVDLTALVNAINGLGQQINQFEGRLAEVARAVATLQKGQDTTAVLLKAQGELNKVSLGYLSLFGEQVLGAGREEILKDAIRDGQSLVQALGKG